MEDQYPYYYNQEFDEDTNKKINLEIMKYAGLFILEKIDVGPEEGGHRFEVPLMGIDEHMEPILDDLMFHDLLDIDSENTCYTITDQGYKYIQDIIKEAENYLNKYQDFEPTTRVNLMKRDRINPLRARFLWGLYDGEFSDIKKWQDDRGIIPEEQVEDWRDFITKKEFYDILFEEINNMEELDDDALDQVLAEAEAERDKNKPQIQIQKSQGSQSVQGSNQADPQTQSTVHYYHDPYYFNPVYDPLFWYIVF